MKLRTTFSATKNALSDFRTTYDFYSKLPTETRDKFWNKECGTHPTKSISKTYDV